MTTDSGRSPVPDLWLERLRLGELAPADARALEDRLRHDPEARAQLEAIDRDDREQRAARLPHRIATAARQRIAARGPDVHRPRVRTLTVAAAGAACLLAVAAVIVRSPQLPGTSPDDGDGDRLKGTGGRSSRSGRRVTRARPFAMATRPASAMSSVSATSRRAARSAPSCR